MEKRMMVQRILARIFYRPYTDVLWRLPVYDSRRVETATTRQERERIYLTLDDGPYPLVTKKILSLLKELKVPATFFLSGEKLFVYRKEIKKLNYEGHSIGSHFFHHIPALGLSKKKLSQELNLTDELLNKNFKQNSHLFRPPYGIFCPRLLKILKEQNKIMILWSLMANDFKWSAEKVIHRLKKSVRGGDVVVFHDSEKSEKVVLEVLPDFIKYCKKNGFEFEKINFKKNEQINP
jgi:peptidoglycan/xylan/chitin deacetylase (PgdA/CDA1 family)